jgi:RimJ/RimL family protein N-acetyltransferase
MEMRGPRVLLRSSGEEDYPFLKRLWNDGRVMKWVGFPDGVGYTDESLKKRFDRRREGAGFYHFIVRDENHRPIGEVQDDYAPEKRRASLDVKFIPSAQGRGYATEALMLIIDLAFCAEPDLEEVYTEPRPGNVAAQKLYTRCGLCPKERPPDLDPDESYWALERSAWLARRDRARRHSDGS